jgi:hypothetical protein
MFNFQTIGLLSQVLAIAGPEFAKDFHGMFEGKTQPGQTYKLIHYSAIPQVIILHNSVAFSAFKYKNTLSLRSVVEVQSIVDYINLKTLTIPEQ